MKDEPELDNKSDLCIPSKLTSRYGLHDKLARGGWRGILRIWNRKPTVKREFCKIFQVKRWRKKIWIIHLSYYRRTRSKTMSERLRKSIRQKLRPSIFTVSTKIIIKILRVINCCLSCSVLWMPWLSFCRKVRIVQIVCLSKLEKRQVTLVSPVKSVENIPELHIM